MAEDVDEDVNGLKPLSFLSPMVARFFRRTLAVLLTLLPRRTRSRSGSAGLSESPSRLLSKLWICGVDERDD
jgi:hypothetical protein